MNGARNDLLTGAARARDQNGAVLRSYLARELQHPQHLLGVSYDAVEIVLLIKPLAQVA